MPGDLHMQVYNFNVPTFGKGVVYDVDQKTRTEQFRFFTEALKKDRLAKYVPQFVAEAEVRCSARCGC
jgi:sterol 14-demethylase